MTDKQNNFINEYIKDCNATQAAIRAGYSPLTANEQGTQIRNHPDVKAEIDKRLAELTMTANEVTKGIEDIAKANLSDYFIEKIIEHTPRIKVPLQQIIDELQEQIDFEEEYICNIEANEEEIQKHDESQFYRKRKLTRLNLELERNPNATRIINGETQLIQSTELDMVRLMADKTVKIKSIKPTQFGLAIETYAADAAQDKLAKIHGLYKEDNEQSRTQIEIGRKIGYGEKNKS